MSAGTLLLVFDALAECPSCATMLRLVTDGARAYAAGTTDALGVERDGAAMVVTCGELVATCGLFHGTACRFDHHNERCAEAVTVLLGDDGRQVDSPTWGGWTAADTNPEAVDLLARYGELVTP